MSITITNADLDRVFKRAWETTARHIPNLSRVVSKTHASPRGVPTPLPLDIEQACLTGSEVRTHLYYIKKGLAPLIRDPTLGEQLVSIVWTLIQHVGALFALLLVLSLLGYVTFHERDNAPANIRKLEKELHKSETELRGLKEKPFKMGRKTVTQSNLIEHLQDQHKSDVNASRSLAGELGRCKARNKQLETYCAKVHSKTDARVEAERNRADEEIRQHTKFTGELVDWERKYKEEQKTSAAALKRIDAFSSFIEAADKTKCDAFEREKRCRNRLLTERDNHIKTMTELQMTEARRARTETLLKAARKASQKRPNRKIKDPTVAWKDLSAVKQTLKAKDEELAAANQRLTTSESALAKEEADHEEMKNKLKAERKARQIAEEDCFTVAKKLEKAEKAMEEGEKKLVAVEKAVEDKEKERSGAAESLAAAEKMVMEKGNESIRAAEDLAAAEKATKEKEIERAKAVEDLAFAVEAKAAAGEKLSAAEEKVKLCEANSQIPSQPDLQARVDKLTADLSEAEKAFIQAGEQFNNVSSHAQNLEKQVEKHQQEKHIDQREIATLKNKLQISHDAGFKEHKARKEAEEKTIKAREDHILLYQQQAAASATQREADRLLAIAKSATTTGIPFSAKVASRVYMGERILDKVAQLPRDATKDQVVAAIDDLNAKQKRLGAQSEKAEKKRLLKGGGGMAAQQQGSTNGDGVAGPSSANNGGGSGGDVNMAG